MIGRRARRRVRDWAATRVTERRQRGLMRLSTAVLCLAALLVALSVRELIDPDRIFTQAAQVYGCALLIALAVEAVGGPRNLLRADLLMLVALYGLVFLEFLFPQDSFAGRVSAQGAQTGTTAVLLGFAGIALGRHVPMRLGPRRPSPPMRDLTPRRLVQLFLALAAIGYFHILLAVNFDIFEAIRQMSLPRFSQSWGRGRLGGVDTLLHELGLVIYLIPPLAGVVFAQYRRYGVAALSVVAAVLALTLYKGFAGGTRSVFIVYVITFTVAYLLARPRMTVRELLMIVTPAIVMAAVATVYMLEFRKIGLANYALDELERETLFVDLNLINVSRLTEVFPAQYDYLGWEIPYNVLIRPIPRAIWPGKPEGLSVGIEEALNAEGMGVTLAATFVGESYMAGGLPAVLAAALMLGALAATWDRVGARLDSRYMQVFYASGFFAAALAMRSVLHVAPALLPSLALWLYGRHVLTIRRRSRRVTSP